MANPKVEIVLGPFRAPGRVITAVKDADDTDLKTVCTGKKDAPVHDPVRVNGIMRCPTCEREEKSYHPYPRGKIGSDGSIAVLTAEDLASAAVSDDVKQTLTFLRCPKDDVDRLALPAGKFYYLGVGEGLAIENYGLIRDVIRATEGEYAWVTKYAYSTKPTTVRAVLKGDVICIQQIADPGQVAQPPNVQVPEYNPLYLPLALQAAEVVAAEFDLATFGDTRKQKIAELLAAATPQAAGVGAATTTVQSTPGDMLASYQAWVTERSSSVAPKVKAVRKAPAKKTVEAPPVQPLPEVIPDNVTVVTPKKRAPRKVAERRSA